jgi:iron complex outermembrane receptor protein
MHTRHRVGLRLALLASVLLFSAAAFSQAITLKGTVRGKDKDPKQFASVSLDGPAHYAATTDENGAFTIEKVTPGKYTVKVRQGDHVEEFANKDVSSGKLDLVVKW